MPGIKSSRRPVDFSDSEREESEYETDGEEDERSLPRKRVEEPEAEFEEEEEEEEEHEEKADINRASVEEAEVGKSLSFCFSGRYPCLIESRVSAFACVVILNFTNSKMLDFCYSGVCCSSTR